MCFAPETFFLRLDASRVECASEPSIFVSDGHLSELGNQILQVVCRLSNRLRAVPSA